MEQDPNNGNREFGPIFGIIIIVGLFVLGGIYFFFLQDPPVEEPLLEGEIEVPSEPGNF